MIARIAAASAAWVLCFLLVACAGVPNPFQPSANAATPAAPGAHQQSSPQSKAQPQQGAQSYGLAQAQGQPSGFADPDAGASNEYRLGPGDVVRVTVYGNDDLTTEAEVSQSGRIGFPLIGEVKIGGLTQGEATKLIAQKLDRGGFVRKPYVNLLVRQYVARQVAIMGEVYKPGKYSINQPVSVTDVLAMAGGITAKGSNNISVLKKDANGNTTKHEVDVKRMLAAADMAKDFQVDAGDIIFVPPAPVFYIYGEVRQPGSYPLANDMTVRQALSVGGGLTLRGTERGIKLDRKSKDGKVESYRAQLTDKVQPDDVLNVPEGWF